MENEEQLRKLKEKTAQERREERIARLEAKIDPYQRVMDNIRGTWYKVEKLKRRDLSDTELRKQNLGYSNPVKLSIHAPGKFIEEKVISPHLEIFCKALEIIPTSSLKPTTYFNGMAVFYDGVDRSEMTRERFEELLEKRLSKTREDLKRWGKDCMYASNKKALQVLEELHREHYATPYSEESLEGGSLR